MNKYIISSHVRLFSVYAVYIILLLNHTLSILLLSLFLLFLPFWLQSVPLPFYFLHIINSITFASFFSVYLRSDSTMWNWFPFIEIQSGAVAQVLALCDLLGQNDLAGWSTTLANDLARRSITLAPPCVLLCFGVWTEKNVPISDPFLI